MLSMQEAQRAIDDIRTVRQDLAERVSCPPAMRLASGVLSGTLCAAQAAPGFIAAAITIGTFAVIGAMALRARRRTGFFVNGYQRGRTRAIALALLAIFEAIYFGSIWLKETHHLGWAPVAGGVLIVPITIYASTLWQNAYCSEFGFRQGTGT